MKRILFIVGSLRKDSFNRQLAQEAEKNLAGLAYFVSIKDMKMAQR